MIYKNVEDRLLQLRSLYSITDNIRQSAYLRCTYYFYDVCSIDCKTCDMNYVQSKYYANTIQK